MKNSHNLCGRLGYQFSNNELFKRALSHRSIGKQNNERLEFLGDSLLNFFIAKALFDRYPDTREGELSRLRANLVQGKTLAELAREFELGEYLILGEGELKSGGFRRDSILADAVEAIIGAIYLDSDLEKCQQVVLSWFAARLGKISLDNTHKDPKTRLQELLQQKKLPLPKYAVVETFGKSHAKEFVIECHLDTFSETCRAVASSKRMAEKLAAEKMLELLSKHTLK